MPTPPPDPRLAGFAALPADHARAAVVVGFSGGLDSTVLLHWLAGTDALRANGLRALHVHHGLHAEADAWATHCRAVCDALAVPLEVRNVTVDRSAGLGLEAAARDARHAAFRSRLRDGEVLALAHHRDDQAETFLLRAMRASGPDGLAAMRTWRRFAPGWLWRPLLALPRQHLQEYAHTHGLHWVEDPSNAQTHPDRNFVRHHVLPLLRERWPHAAAALARSADFQGDTIALLAEEDAYALASARTLDPRVLSIPALVRLPTPRRARVLRHWIQTLDLPPLPAQGLAAIEHHLLPAPRDAAPCFRWAGAAVTRWRDLLHAGRPSPPLPVDYRKAWDGRGQLALPTGDTLHFDGPGLTDDAGDFIVHARQGGERLTLPGRPHRHALKQVLQSLGIPPWERARLPLLSDPQGRLLAAADLAQDAAFDAWLRERNTRLVWSPAPG